MPIRLCCIVLLLTTVGCLHGAVIDDFRSIDAWKLNPDGGRIEIDHLNVDGKPCLHLTFTAEGRGYGNAARAISLPPTAAGIEIEFHVHKATPPGSLFVWLFEKDGDGYLAHVKPEGRWLHQLSMGWHTYFIPISAFAYEPRGNGKREMLSVDRMLVGMNSGASEVSVSRLAFRTVERSGKVADARTDNLRIEDGAKGRVAILRDRFPGNPAYSDPDVLGDTLRSAGFGVTFLRAGDVADRSVLAGFDCLVLPYGPCYPHAARDSIKAYLKSGGSLFTTGGYAFDQPHASDGSGNLLPLDATLTAHDIAGEADGVRPLNHRYGRPGDTMGLDPEQIGIFDPTFHLRHVEGIRSAEMQHIVPGVEMPVKPEGYAACSMLGSNNPVFPEKWGRHIPLVEAVDEFGRTRGGVGAIARNYAGPYAGSSWAFFGVTNTDLFAKDGPMLPHLPAIIESVAGGMYLHSLGTDLACYRDGEYAVLSCRLANPGRKNAVGRVVFRVYNRAGTEVFCHVIPQEFRVAPNADVVAETEWRPERFASDLYRVTAELIVGGKTMDVMETGFAAYSSKDTASGPKIELRGNYFEIDGRPVLLSGANETGAIFYSGNESPLVWDRDLSAMSANGVNILRVLHFSPFLSDKPSPSAVKPLDLAVDRMPVETERKLDALVQLCQRHRVVLFLSIHDWMGVALSDEELEAQRKFARLIAARYKDVPGFMIDIQNEPKSPESDESPDVVREWNDFLRAKYGSGEVLREAWKLSPPEAPLGSVAYRKGTDAWDDIRTLDAGIFRNMLLDRWSEANRSGAKEGDPTMLVGIGFLQEYFALNKLACMEHSDFANMHSYSPLETFRLDFKLFDRRFEGKSMSLGEFGSHADHEKRIRGEDSPGQDWWRYLMTGHYAFGEGGSFIANWCWKDMDDVIFPWGIVYPCGGPRKDLLLAYRNQSLLFRQVGPKYTPPHVFLVVPLDQMLGGQSGKVQQVLYRTVERLMDDHLVFGTIDDRHLDQLPSNARVLVYPIPFSIPDNEYAQLKAFAEGGGTLVITGDVRYDALRRPTRSDRLEDLCGVGFISENYPMLNLPDLESPCIKVEPTTARPWMDGMHINRLGRGEVIYSPKPLLTGDYLSCLGKEATRSDVSHFVRVEGGGHAFRIDEPDPARTVVLANLGEPRTLTVYEGNLGGVQIPLAANGTGLMRIENGRKLLAVEAQGSVKMEGWTLDMRGHFAVYSCDGKDLRESREIVVIPFGEGELDLGPLAADLVVQTGDVVGGRWQVLSESAGPRIKASGADSFDIRIVAPRDRLETLGRFVVSEMTLRK